MHYHSTATVMHGEPQQQSGAGSKRIFSKHHLGPLGRLSAMFVKMRVFENSS